LFLLVFSFLRLCKEGGHEQERLKGLGFSAKMHTELSQQGVQYWMTFLGVFFATETGITNLVAEIATYLLAQSVT